MVIEINVKKIDCSVCPIICWLSNPEGLFKETEKVSVCSQHCEKRQGCLNSNLH